MQADYHHGQRMSLKPLPERRPVSLSIEQLYEESNPPSHTMSTMVDHLFYRGETELETCCLLAYDDSPLRLDLAKKKCFVGNTVTRALLWTHFCAGD